jgi:hypothetical protein
MNRWTLAFRAVLVAGSLALVAISLKIILLPEAAVLIWASDYKEKMFACDQVMREHFIAKNLVESKPTSQSVLDLRAAEVGLTTCHHYDQLRKKMIDWGVSNNRLARLGLEAIEKKASDVRTFVETHEFRY